MYSETMNDGKAPSLKKYRIVLKPKNDIPREESDTRVREALALKSLKMAILNYRLRPDGSISMMLDSESDKARFVSRLKESLLSTRN